MCKEISNKYSIKFRRKPIPIRSEFRIIYKISCIVLVLGMNSKREKSSLHRISIFLYGISSNRNMEKFEMFLNNGYRMKDVFWTYDPSIKKAINFGITKRIFNIKETNSNIRIELSEEGIDFYEKLISDEKILIREKAFLNRINRSKLPEGKIDDLLKERKKYD